MVDLSSLHTLAEETNSCGDVQRQDTYLGLRVASLFIILATSVFGAAFPVLASRLHFLNVHKLIFEIGTAKLDSLGVKEYNSHRSSHERSGESDIQDLRLSDQVAANSGKVIKNDSELGLKEKLALHNGISESALAQLLGVAILEFGVVFHSILIGMTLAVDEDFIVLFIVLIFHQMFEGLGLGTRLASLDLPLPYRSWVHTPSMTSSIVAGTFDSISAGILLYTGLVELLAHEFIFNPVMHRAPIGKLLYACVMMVLGAGIMALIGRWA
ncbi:ZIP Zinc/iron transport family protein [Rhizoctonia solani]|uniref:ZIP Zinc/iron transport family protein n=1 Tax=Rhizoctonia solani TaxID=456999 RepID=A0A8H8NZE2_9AGAM|nr:ZIP Zinc/iron transport family protein [Rhizoctonia solani]QRW21126.1 ZIP Zinc/iron transport family protein [Rhizoctonia solani]